MVDILHDLVQDLEHAGNDIVAEFIDKPARAIAEQRRSDCKRIQVIKDRMKQLHEEIAIAMRQEKERNELNSEQSAALERLAAQIQQLQLQKNELLSKVEDEKENISNIEQINSMKLKDIESKEGHLNVAMEKFVKGISCFERNLGLQTKKVDNEHLQFGFTLISEQDPLRKYSFMVKIAVSDQERKWQVTECSPEVSVVDQLTAELNRTNDLCAFLCRMRKEFKKIATV